MSITFPKTFLAQEVANAVDVRNNLDAMQKKQAAFVGSDFLNTPWINTHHIMEGRYDPISNLSFNVSGIFGGRNNGSFLNNLSYTSRWLTNRTGSTSTNNPRAYIPFTNITFDILRPCTLFFQWSMIHQSESDSDSTNGFTKIQAALNDKFVNPGVVNHQVYESEGLVGVDILIDGVQTTNGFVLENLNNTFRQFSIGLIGISTAGKCQNVSWSVSLECFYM